MVVDGWVALHLQVLPRPIFKMHIEVSYGHAAELTAGSKLSLSKQESKTQELWVVSAAFGDKKIIEWSKGAPRENLLALLPYAAVAAPVAQRTAKPGAASSISSVPWEPTTRASWKPSDGRVMHQPFATIRRHTSMIGSFRMATTTHAAPIVFCTVVSHGQK